MFRNVYHIVIPDSTPQEVVDWFEFMQLNGKLEDTLIKLITEKISEDFSIQSLNSSQNDSQKLLSARTIDEGELFESLFNWSSSANAVFNEETKIKKTMFYI